MPPYTVEYYCPSQGEFWQRPRGKTFLYFEIACNWADVLKPSRGLARVVDGAGDVVYQV
jgi:hypothetical protein